MRDWYIIEESSVCEADLEARVPLWVKAVVVLELLVVAALIIAFGFIIKWVYWGACALWLAVKLWAAWVRRYRQMTRDDFYG